MKAITMRQPLASLVALGVVPLSLHGFAPPFIGPVAIHASKEFTLIGKMRSYEEPFSAALKAAGYVRIQDIPTSSIVGVAELHRVVKTEVFRPLLKRYDECLFPIIGDFKDGLFVWEWNDAFLLHQPIPCSGDTGLWDLPEVLSASVGQTLALVNQERRQPVREG